LHRTPRCFVDTSESNFECGIKKNIFSRSKWTGLRSAIQFLTIIPCGRGHDFDARAALPFFPLCGLLIGVLLVMVDAMATLVWPRPVVALLDVIALAAISGALHLDGVADTADGLYGHREPEQALAIMKDSRIGAMGSIVWRSYKYKNYEIDLGTEQFRFTIGKRFDISR